MASLIRACWKNPAERRDSARDIATMNSNFWRISIGLGTYLKGKQ